MFTLDDAYIHLALAENIMQGHYGINLNEYSAPASSIIWPFLIAPFSGLAVASYIILIANTVFSLLTLLLFWLTLSPADTPLEGVAEQQTLLNVMLILLIPACNLIGLIFTGMEHSLQVMLAVAIICGLNRESLTARLDWWTLSAIILSPLVRYECLAISLPAAGYLIFRGHRKAGVLAVGVMMMILAGFSLFLVSIGQNPLPNSVTAKSQIVYEQNASSVFVNFVSGIEKSRGVLLAICLLFMLSQVISREIPESKRLLCATVSVSIVLHLLFGQFGWFCRYEIYIWASVLAVIGFMLKPFIYRNSASYGVLEKTLLMFAALFLLCFPYLLVLANIPVGANNIYEQQYQMHRFATEFYKKPVAANDIGFLSYRNPSYILDLWGLASNEALSSRHQAKHEHWMEGLVQSKNIGLAMIYDDWFPEIPDNWHKAGVLTLGKTRITPAMDRVAFYVIKIESSQEIHDLLKKFTLTLPAGVEFVFADNADLESRNGATR
ncbi:MAG: hypothetical protein CVV41_12270 [Candidatus Riflebacteria bacterium HGW-Riflebacteria-1]|nr:MAG: hypothetical protein CVV41_12270 [Candidatus Riflebacteria bacterium HGW-Riflebacteria-1]